MSEAAVAEQQPTATEGEQQTEEQPLGPAGEKALGEWKQRAKEAERKARDIERQLEQQRVESMTEAERAVAEAEKRGRTTALTEVGMRLARSEFNAAAARRNPDFDTASALEYLDLAKFVGEDGEPDAKAVKAAVERLVPAPAGAVPSFDGGARTSAAGPDMNSIIRRTVRGG